MAWSWEEIMISMLLLLIMFIVPVGVLISPKSQPSEPIHIFLCFRGEDTRDTFAPFLRDALNLAGFNVFMDDQSIRLGQDIDLVIQNAIERSMGAAIILSRDFASSEWCLDELVLVLEKKKMLGSNYVLQPIYVDDVQPHEVLNQRGSYYKSFAKHRKWYSCWDSNKLKLWRDALKEIAGLRGMILKGKWSKFINEIVEEIREEFRILGITVNPRCCAHHTTRMYRMHAVLESLKMLAIIGNLIFLLNKFLGSSFIKQLCTQFIQLMATISSTNDKSLVIENGLVISAHRDSAVIPVPISILILILTLTLTLILILVLCIILLAIVKVKSEKNRSKGKFMPELMTPTKTIVLETKAPKIVEPEKTPSKTILPEMTMPISTNEASKEPVTASTIKTRVRKSFVATINKALKTIPYRISTISPA